MKMVNVHKAKTELSALLSGIETNGEPIMICRNGEPVADLVPHRHHDRLQPHPQMSKITILYDPTEPLTPDEWPENDDVAA